MKRQKRLGGEVEEYRRQVASGSVVAADVCSRLDRPAPCRTRWTTTREKEDSTNWKRPAFQFGEVTLVHVVVVKNDTEDARCVRDGDGGMARWDELRGCFSARKPVRTISFFLNNLADSNSIFLLRKFF